MILPRKLSFDNVAIKQKKNICRSRSDVDIKTTIMRGLVREIPLIAANMESVTDPQFCIDLYNYGGFGILHRAYCSPASYTQAVRTIAAGIPHVAVSIGVQEQDRLLVDQLVKYGANVICIDIAHGYCDPVIEMCKYLYQQYSHVSIIAGNTICVDMLDEVNDYVSAVKVGCGSGSACETSSTAGCTEPQFNAVMRFKERSLELGLPIISDGGIRTPSDFVKAIGAGAASVMAGSIFCRCPESAGPIVYVGDEPKKMYSGMASRNVQQIWKGGLRNGCPEGKTVVLDVGEGYKELLCRYAGALRSGITYAGCNNIDDFRTNCEFVEIS